VKRSSEGGASPLACWKNQGSTTALEADYALAMGTQVTVTKDNPRDR
jgi:hypothetical protein